MFDDDHPLAYTVVNPRIAGRYPCLLCLEALPNHTVDPRIAGRYPCLLCLEALPNHTVADVRVDIAGLNGKKTEL